LSPRARAIQRKSIHIFSTAAICALVACAGSGPGLTTTGDRKLVAVPGMFPPSLSPGAKGTALFALTSGGVGIPGQLVTFSLLDDPSDPGDDPKGATLAKTSAVTDAAGGVTVEVRAGGETTLNLRATAGSTQSDPLKILVALGKGSVVVTPYFAPDSNAAAQTTNIEVMIFDGLPCATINLASPPKPPLDAQMLSASGGTTLPELVRTTSDHAVVSRALNSRRNAIAVGCVDVAGTSLITDGTVEIWLPLHDIVPDPIGTFTVTSVLQLQAPLAAAAAIAGPWRDLGDCPLDPAQLLLDCVIDALSPATDQDPLDCVPNGAPGGEGALGDAFMARRGLPILDGNGAATGCRGATYGVAPGAPPSLDAIAMGLFGSPAPPLLVALPAIGTEAAHVLDRPQLHSVLTIGAAGPPDQYAVMHTLTSVTFESYKTNPTATTTTADVDLVPLALPALTAYASATTRDGLLVIDSHGFSLRLGRVARAGFARTSLAPRLGVADASAGKLVAGIAGLAKSADGAASDCAAFDLVLCAAVGAPTKCLATACPAGLLALTNRLDATFDAADGTGLDFYMSGSTPVLDPQNKGYATHLGVDLNDPTTVPGWSIDLQATGGRARGIASLDAMRE
jgi:hypothetical protein